MIVNVREQVLDLDPVWHYNRDLRMFHPEHMVVIGDDGIKALCRCFITPHTSHLTPRTSHLTPHTSHLFRSVCSPDAARSYRAGTFKYDPAHTAWRASCSTSDIVVA